MYIWSARKYSHEFGLANKKEPKSHHWDSQHFISSFHPSRGPSQIVGFEWRFHETFMGFHGGVI